MSVDSSEKLLSRIIAIGAGLTTIIVINGSVTDPVNAPKMLSLGVASFAALGVVLTQLIAGTQLLNTKVWLFSVAFLFFGFTSLLFGDSPISQELYGVYGRNNGFLTYLFLTVLFLSSTLLSSRKSFNRLIHSFLIAGAVNVIYCLWVIAFGDFLSWNNPYGNILGTLGNPNFIGAFLGMFLAAFLAYGISNESSRYFKYSMLIVLPVTAFEIVDSQAIQGRVVGAAGVAIVGFFYFRSRLNRSALWLYSGAISIFGFFALLGALQIGPLTGAIYKTSVSLRGQYWLAGWNTGQSHPFSGVGMDSFGDWYRRSRDLHALDLPGVDVVVNAAHNVPIDMFAFGGWPLFLSYLAIMLTGGLALIRVILRTKEFDPILVILTTLWVGYQLQSIISINQIGLAIWGWVLTGASIAYEKQSRFEKDSDEGPNLKVRRPTSYSPVNVLAAAAFGLGGLVLALPPLIADSIWRGAQISRSVENIEKTMVPGYFNPQNSMKYLTNIKDLEQSNFLDYSHKYALEAVEWNPESYDLWRMLYFLQKSTPEERATALRNMKRLDPLNPDVTSLK
jgi:hypothetical protein